MPVTLTIYEFDAPGITLTGQEAPRIIVTSATTPGPAGPQGIPGTDGSDANWAAYTQAEFDAISSPDPSTLYIIVPA